VLMHNHKRQKTRKSYLPTQDHLLVTAHILVQWF